MKSLRFIAPLLLFVVLLIFLWVGLSLNPREVPSPLIGKPAPSFRLARLDDPSQTIAENDLRGRVWLLNVWASWCVSCVQEHPVLVQLSKQGVVPIYGLNYKDERIAAQAWLAKNGNPYTLSMTDPDGKVGLDYGVYGVPETYVIDKAGVIRLKQIGPVTPQVLSERILPLVKRLQAS
ncbi:MAG TPA: DsbE family thiol:disulfide interchange protein [Burkholderiales bacterium]|nr:DsbE family thiol:disulfide interchange protein [Burkholderiales bacterium]